MLLLLVVDLYLNYFIYNYILNNCCCCCIYVVVIFVVYVIVVYIKCLKPIKR